MVFAAHSQPPAAGAGELLTQNSEPAASDPIEQIIDPGDDQGYIGADPGGWREDWSLLEIYTLYTQETTGGGGPRKSETSSHTWDSRRV
jgi:hypothetical protein